MDDSNQKAYSQKVWAVGGGKGGVGKSLVTANTSICLALLGHKVTVIDLDLGGANLHTCLGIPIPEMTLSDYVQGKVNKISDLLVQTPIPNLTIISGAQDALGIANLQSQHKEKILNSLKDLDSEYVVFDLGAGTTINTLDFFIHADKGILVALPEPTSIENTYRFIKSVFFRKIKQLNENYEVSNQINQMMNAKISTPNSSPADLLKKLREDFPVAGERIIREVEKFTPSLIINQVREQKDIEIGHSITAVSKRYFNLNIKFSGYLHYDSAVWQSVKNRKPLLMQFPDSRLVNNFEKIVGNLLR